MGAQNLDNAVLEQAGTLVECRVAPCWWKTAAAAAVSTHNSLCQPEQEQPPTPAEVTKNAVRRSTGACSLPVPNEAALRMAALRHAFMTLGSSSLYGKTIVSIRQALFLPCAQLAMKS
jgi:hypothetical protein